MQTNVVTHTPSSNLRHRDKCKGVPPDAIFHFFLMDTNKAKNVFFRSADLEAHLFSGVVASSKFAGF
jgi:hypothetical protein